VEEALCFGWIDGINKKISDDKHAQRLSPRTKKSNWTEINNPRRERRGIEDFSLKSLRCGGTNPPRPGFTP
jgi:hypothetical protein